jgi:hypothetical protein
VSAGQAASADAAHSGRFDVQVVMADTAATQEQWLAEMAKRPGSIVSTSA